MCKSLLQNRKYSIGAEILTDKSGIDFRVWAPEHDCLELITGSEDFTKSINKLSCNSCIMKKDSAGFFSITIPFNSGGLLYCFRIDGNTKLLPDPVSRFQPHGSNGLSQVIDYTAYRWNDTEWKGIPDDGKILYEMHVGTFTPEGTWQTAQKQLPELASLGVTVIELLPVAEFEGMFDWGYNGIFQFAPYHGYGTPDDFRSFVDSAHRHKIGIILDVVYNHLGAGAEIFKDFSPYYFTSKYKNEWGAAINFDDVNSEPVRQYFLTNAAYWIEEYHLDGFRIDATQQIFDSSDKNIISELVQIVKSTAKMKKTFIIAENENQNTRLYYQNKIDAVWSDDFHRCSMVALTGHAEAYYSDYTGSPQEFISAIKHGYLYQGQYYTWQKKKRGTPSFNLHSQYFIHYLQNHDQIANSLRGLRIHAITDPSLYRTFTALLLLCPQIPLLFQGQEFCSSAPFYFFTDKNEDALSRARKGRKMFLSQFLSINNCGGPLMADPGDPETFKKCKLNFSERFTHEETYRLHKDLMRIRKNDSVFSINSRKAIDGAVLGKNAFIIRYFGLKDRDDRILVINLGGDLLLKPNPEPLTAPPQDCKWKIIFNSEDPLYGGNGNIPLELDGIPNIGGRSAFFLGCGIEQF